MAIDSDSRSGLRDRDRRTIVAGHYEVNLDEPLGEGGMALVYHGRDMRTRRDVALKTLRPEFRRDPESRARFRREARTMAFLMHPNVVRVYDLYEDETAPWAVLEYVPGRTLKDDLAERGPFGVEETALILEQTARALDHLHKRGMVHLDVKPQNIVRTPDGVIKLIDFGITQRSGEPQETVGGAAFGTAAYLSPEQVRGDAVGAAADVYGLGCVVYELLTGRPPFLGGDGDEGKGEVLRSHLERTPTRPSRLDPDLPEWVDDVVLMALAKDPDERYDECESFARLFRLRLEEAAALQDAPTIGGWVPPESGTPGPRERSLGRRMGEGAYRTGGRLARKTRRLRGFLWKATLVVALLNCLLALFLLFNRGEVPGLYRLGGEIGPGATVRVVTDGLNLRADPTRDAGVVTRLSRAETVTVTGESASSGGEQWWPVRVDRDGETAVGWVSADGISGETRSPKDRLMDWLRGLVGG